MLKVAPEDILINYTPFGFSDWQTEVSKIKAFGSAGKKTAVVSTINGDANVPFYKELGNQGIKATDIPVVAFSVGEEELAGLDTKPLVGHLAAWNYFESIKTPANEAFIKEWHAFTKNPKRTTNDPMEAHYIGFNMWVKAVEKVKSTDPDKVIEALPGTKAPNLTGGISELLPNHHITKPVFIGEIRPDGQFDVVWKTKGLVPGAAWSAYLPGSKDLIGRLGYAQVRQLQHRNEEVRRGVINDDAAIVTSREGRRIAFPHHRGREPCDASLPSLPRRFAIGLEPRARLRDRARRKPRRSARAFHRRRFQRDQHRHQRCCRQRRPASRNHHSRAAGRQVWCSAPNARPSTSKTIPASSPMPPPVNRSPAPRRPTLT